MKSWGALRAHATGALSATLGFLPVFALVADPGVFSVIFFLLVFGPIVWLTRPGKWQQVAPPQIDMIPAALPVPAPIIVPVSPPVIDAVPIQPFATVVKGEREPVEDPLANWKRTTPTPPEPSRPHGVARKKASATSKSRSGKASPVKGRKLDVVRFDYINAEGEYSSRRLVVNKIAEEYFEGFDTERQETRTFRYDRVVGEITSENTGEIISPMTWADDLEYRL